MEPYENFKPEDLVIQTYTTKHSGGVKAVHLPTGTVVSCDSGTNQHLNRHLALAELWQKVQGKPSYAELKAQVEQLREFAELIVEWKEYGFEKAKTLLDSTPAQCLAEIKARAGRDGFIEGAKHAHSQGLSGISNVADEYCDKIRKAAEAGEL